MIVLIVCYYCSFMLLIFLFFFFLLLFVFCFFFFFFQAEDGIRDLYVTGVQTCALPISSAPANRCSQGSAWMSTSAFWSGRRSVRVSNASSCGGGASRLMWSTRCSRDRKSVV